MHIMTNLLDLILDRQNMYQALKRVYSNKGVAGVDGITIEEVDGYIRENWQEIKVEIKERRYKPQPVLRVEILKPNGGTRQLGIPTVMDRIIQQGITQVLNPIVDKEFSHFSYGFRPGRNCEMAVTRLLEYFNDGYLWIVDIDLEKFFDTVPQDKLMSLVHNIIDDPDTESLIRRFLQAGIMDKGKYLPSEKGTPQGGNLSPLLSNIMLNELDKELESRGLNFVRYADDCIITVKSQAAAKRVMQSITNWIERKLGLKINASKSRITRPPHLKYLGFGFWKDGRVKEWKVPSKRQWGLQKLGINKDLARLTSYCGNRYYFVATKTCVTRAIAKDILIQRGLVSPLDYYIHRRNARFN